MPTLKNARHERFAQELAKGKTADEAYQLAGFKANRGNASTLNQKQSIQTRVSELLAREALIEEKATEKAITKLGITKERVLSELAALGFSNMMDYLRPTSDGLMVLDLSALTRDQAAAIQEITIDQVKLPDADENGDTVRASRVKFKLADKRAPLVDIGRHFGMFKEKLELTGKGGGPVEISDVTTAKRRAAVALLLSRKTK